MLHPGLDVSRPHYVIVSAYLNRLYGVEISCHIQLVPSSPLATTVTEPRNGFRTLWHCNEMECVGILSRSPLGAQEIENIYDRKLRFASLAPNCNTIPSQPIFIDSSLCVILDTWNCKY